ncbi:hypothetical protein P7H21_09610 [Paenibacillus larvae]|nr:hypothetical protein [Paenibacillus larvae]MDT2304167.1 hypothetical protein [Paenibacillus larvae]
MTEQEELLQLDVHYTFNQQETKEIEVETFSIPEIISFESLPMGTDSERRINCLIQMKMVFVMGGK